MQEGGVIFCKNRRIESDLMDIQGGMTCRTTDIEAGIRFRANGRKVTAPQVNSKRERSLLRLRHGGGIYPNDIRDNRRRDGREGELARS